MRKLAVAIVVSTAMVIDYLANLNQTPDRQGWDITGGLVFLWGAWQLRRKG